MDPENKEKSPEENFGKVIETLHNKSKLSSLRTYQGDMAEFIKSKNESVFSITLKEKERKEEKIKEEKRREIKIEPKIEIKTEAQEAKVEKRVEPKIEPKIEKKEVEKKVVNKNVRTNITIAFVSLILVVLGVLAFLFVFKFVKTEPVSNVVVEAEIIPYNSVVNLTEVTNENFGQKLGELSFTGGLSIVKISDNSGVQIKKTADLFNFLKLSPPGALIRTFGNKYMVGVISQDEKIYPFIAITINDFGSAFSAMLDWEGNMEKDLYFLGTSTSTATTTESFVWKDLIIKNKDARGLINQKGQAKIVYTFLDKNTILITNSTDAIGEISALYASRAVVR
jgi:hypothetical protein